MHYVLINQLEFAFSNWIFFQLNRYI